MAGKSFPLSVVISAVDKITAPMRRINQQISNAVKPVKKLKEQFSLLSKESGLTDLGHKIASVTRNIGLLAIAGGAAFAKLAKDVVNSGDEIGETAIKLGVSADALQKWRHAASRAGMQAGEMDKSMSIFSRTMGNMRAGTGAMHSLLSRVNPAWLEQMKATKGNEEGMRAYLNMVRSVNDEQKKSALLAAGFGKGGTSLKLLTKLPESEINAIIADFVKLGGVMDDATIGAAGRADDAFIRFGVALTGLRNKAIGPLLEKLTPLVTKLTELLAANGDQYIKDLSEGLKGVAFNLRDIMGSLSPFVDAMKWLVENLGAGNTLLLLMAVNFAMLASPIGLAVAALLSLWVIGQKISEWLEGFPAITNAIGFFIDSLLMSINAMIDAFKILGTVAFSSNPFKEIYNIIGGDDAKILAAATQRSAVDINISGNNIPFGFRVAGKATGGAKITEENLGYMMPAGAC